MTKITFAYSWKSNGGNGSKQSNDSNESNGIERIPMVEGRVTMCLRKGSMMSPCIWPARGLYGDDGDDVLPFFSSV